MNAEPEEIQGSNSTEDESSKPRFRILRIDGKKKAFSLEPIFWTALEAAANSKNIPLNEHISNIIGKENPKANMSSSLRSAVTEWLWHKATTERHNELSLLGERMVRSSPLPSFIINEKRQLTRFNAAFQKFLGADKAELETTKFELRLGVSLTRVIEALETGAGRALSLPFSFSNTDAHRAGKINATILRRDAGNTELFCIIKSIDS